MPVFLLLLFLGSLLPAAHAQPAEPAAPGDMAFQPPGMWCWDNWFVKEGDHWHAFYLQLPQAVGPERRWKNNDLHKHVGHAVSTDLRHWQNVGPALVALSGTWNDRHIATGSITQHAGRWWLLFTGRGTQGDGVGLATSTDLTTWKTEPQPLFPLIDTFAETAPAFFESTWQGETRRWAGISDPYVLPQPQDGWFYLVLCARALGVPLPESGCLTLMRSRDLQHWQPAGIVAWPRCFERMETPQLWLHEGQWLLSFGGVLNMPWVRAQERPLPAAVRGQASHQNFCYLLPTLPGPAREEDLRHISVPKGCYIMKVHTTAPGQDMALFTRTVGTDSGISRPYPVTYAPDHTPSIALPED